MKVALCLPKYYDTSVRIYIDNIIPHIEQHSIEIIKVQHNRPIPDEADIVWDPNCTGAKYPNKRIILSNKKWVVTLHGASNLSLPLHYTFSTIKEKTIGWLKNIRRRFVWFFYKHKVEHIITVSKFAKEEIIEQLSINATKISVIYHGYNDNLFFPRSGEKSYLLHVSIYQKVKNIDRIITAFEQIPVEKRMPLIIIAPNYPDKINNTSNLTLITEKLPQKEIVKYMQSAYAFIFPSIRESFGLPILEAFGCAVPVISSNTSALKEIVGDAGILVNPFSVDEIRNAMENITENKILRNELALKAEKRAKDFSWEKSAFMHAEIFKRIYNAENNL